MVERNPPRQRLGHIYQLVIRGSQSVLSLTFPHDKSLHLGRSEARDAPRPAPPNALHEKEWQVRVWPRGMFNDTDGNEPPLLVTPPRITGLWGIMVPGSGE